MPPSTNVDEYSDISSAERLASAIEAFDGHTTFQGRPVTWDMLPDESKAISARMIRNSRKNREAVNPSTGLTAKQVDQLIKHIVGGLNELVPEYVASEVNNILPALVNPIVQEAVTSILKSLDTAITVAEISRVETRALRLQLDQVQTKGFVENDSLSEPADDMSQHRINELMRSMDGLSARVDSLEHRELQVGPKGEPGQRGEKGEKGERGEPGEHGLDALDIDIVQGLVAERSYGTGTFASHNGGLLRALRNTDPIEEKTELSDCGWRIVVDGVAGIEACWVDERTLEVMTVRTSGVRRAERKIFPIPIYRGVYLSGRRYDPGDLVTHKGSMFIAKTTTEAAPDVGPAEWQLCVKRGRDAVK